MVFLRQRLKPLTYSLTMTLLTSALKPGPDALRLGNAELLFFHSRLYMFSAYSLFSLW